MRGWLALLLVAAGYGPPGHGWAAQTWTRPAPLSFPQNGRLLAIGDSQTQCVIRDPAPEETTQDTALWNGRTMRFLFPDETGARMTDTSYWYPGSGLWADAYAAGIYPDATDWGKVKYYSHAATWAHTLADKLGTPYWYALATGGANLGNEDKNGVSMNGGLEYYALHNPHVAAADVIVIHIGINDVNSGVAAATLIQQHKDVVTGVYARNPTAKVLVLGVQPFGGHATYDTAAKRAVADSLDDWIAGHAPYYDDSTGAKQSADGYFARYAANGQFSTFAYAEWFRNYNSSSADSTWPACGDTLDPRYDEDYLHKSWRGDNYLAFVLAWKVFGCDSSYSAAAETTDVATDWITPLYARPAQTIYVNVATGDNFVNWMNPFSAARPLSTLQAAVFRASSGDNVLFTAGEYASYWHKDIIGFFWPWAYQTTSSARVTFDGQGSTLTRLPGIITILEKADHEQRPDSSYISRLTLKDWTFADWDSTTGTNSPGAFQMYNMTGLRFEDCTFTDVAHALEMGYLYGRIGQAARMLEVDGCTIDGWDKNTDTNGYFCSVAADSGFRAGIEITNCAFVDTTGAGKTMCIYNNSVAAATTSSLRLTLVGNTFIVDSMAAASELIGVPNADVICVNNAFSLGDAMATSDYVLIKGHGSGSTAQSDTLWFANNVITNGTNGAGSEIVIWSTDAERFSNCVYQSTDPPCATSSNRERQYTYSGDYLLDGTISDTLKYGGTQAVGGTLGANTLATHSLASMGITTASTHASIGSTQYADELYLWPGAISGRGSARLNGPWKLLQLVNNDVLPEITAADQDTYYSLPRVYNESDAVIAESWLDAWRLWPAATRAKILYRFDSHVMSIAGADTTYTMPAALIAAVNAGSEPAADSLDASTWFVFPRPYNLTDELQLAHWMDYIEVQTDTTRRKLRFRVAGSDVSLIGPDSTFAQGLWAVLAAINGAAAAVSDSLDSATWFALPRAKNSSQATQERITLYEHAIWPEATRRKIRLVTQ